MKRVIVIIGVAALGVAAVGTAAALSYVTAAGDQTRWGVRVFDRLGIDRRYRRVERDTHPQAENQD